MHNQIDRDAEEMTNEALPKEFPDDFRAGYYQAGMSGKANVKRH